MNVIDPARIQPSAEDLITAINIEVAFIDPDPNNVRATPLSEADAAQLRASIAAQGVLSPILVRPTGDRYRVVFGAQRLAACIALGYVAIPALVRDMTDAEAAAAQAAENMARTSMAPVDQWLAIRRLQEHGFSAIAAGEQLGLAKRRTLQLDRLGAMAPEVIEGIRKSGMPDDRQLITIAEAPLETQRAAMATKSARKADGSVSWWAVAEACQQQSIARSVARFDVEACGVAFMPDLFGQDPDAAYTTDVAGFLKAQRAWLKQHVKQREGSERIALGEPDQAGNDPKPPAGWERIYDHTPQGQEPATFSKRSKKMTVLWVNATPQHRLGHIERMVIQEKEKPKAKGKAGAITAGPGAAPVVGPIERPVVTEKGRAIIAATKTHALQQHLAEIAATGKPRADIVLPMLLLALTGGNVTLRGGDRGVAHVPTAWIAAALVNEQGLLRPDAATTAPGLACRLLGALLVAPGPNIYTSSREAADWIGRYLGIVLPRWDSADMLEHVSGEGLRAAASAVGLANPPGKVSALRAALVGHAEAWVPPGAAWDAPGPDSADRAEAFEEIEDVLADAEAGLGEAGALGAAEAEAEKQPAPEPDPAPAKKGRSKKAKAADAA